MEFSIFHIGSYETCITSNVIAIAQQPDDSSAPSLLLILCLNTEYLSTVLPSLCAFEPDWLIEMPIGVKSFCNQRSKADLTTATKLSLVHKNILGNIGFCLPCSCYSSWFPLITVVIVYCEPWYFMFVLSFKQSKRLMMQFEVPVATKRGKTWWFVCVSWSWMQCLFIRQWGKLHSHFFLPKYDYQFCHILLTTIDLN